MERSTMDDLSGILGVSEDDMVVDVRYCILYILSIRSTTPHSPNQFLLS
jgi:hypothetical protein